MPDPAELEIVDLHKRYGDTRALDGLSLTVRPGEVLGVAGPNGAGKSTLVRILAGEESPDRGELRMTDGRWSPRAGHGGAAVVHQEPQLFPTMSTADNLLVGRETTRLRRPRCGPAERDLLDELELANVADRPVEACRLAAQQHTEIARAVAKNAQLFLFDEPNSALTEEESIALFRRVRSLAEAGKLVILVSHRLSELASHCSRVAVIRDGRCTAVIPKERLTAEAVAHELVAGETTEKAVRDRPLPAGGSGAAWVEVDDWTHGVGAFSGVSLRLEAGELLALVGVEGSGARELLRSLAFADPAHGSVRIGGRERERLRPRHTAYVPATRELSLYGHMTVEENLAARLTREIATPWGRLRRARLRQIAARARDDFGIKASALQAPIRSLSGGNQQKVAIAQALATRPRLLLVEEPTRGVDVRSRREIYRLLRAFVSEPDKGALMFCTEVSEVYEAADRVIVVGDGRLASPLDVREHDSVEALARAIARTLDDLHI